jgi:hypothetical protein
MFCNFEKRRHESIYIEVSHGDRIPHLGHKPPFGDDNQPLLDSVGASLVILLESANMHPRSCRSAKPNAWPRVR